MTFQQAPLAQLVIGGSISYGVVQPGTENTEGVPILRVKDLRGNQIDLTEPIRVSHDVSKRHGRTILHGGEVLVSLVGSVGLAAVTDERVRGWNVARAIAVLRPVPEIGPQWLQLCLQSRAAQDQIRERLNTTVQATLNLADLKMIRVPVPDSTTRAAIAAVLGALDEKSAANSSLISIADQLASNLVKSRVVAGVSIDLQQIASVTMGSSPQGVSFNESGTGIAFYQGVRDFGVRTPTERVWTVDPVRFAEKDDTLVSVRAPVGRVNLAAAHCSIGRGLAAVASTDGRPSTLFHLVQLADWAPFEAEGTVFGSINRRQLMSISLPVLDELNHPEIEVAGLEALIAGHLAENRTLTELRDTLLPALMSGRLRVKDAERQVEDAV